MAVIAKYKFNSTLYADLIPEFNAEFTNYTVTDETTETDSEGNVIKTRVIEHDTLLPTLMRFGRAYVEGESATDNRTDSLLKVLDMNTSELTSCSSMFRYNTNLTSITCEWDTSNVTDMSWMFQSCNKLTSLDLSNFNTSNVIDMGWMFDNCNNLTSLDVSNFDTSKVTNIYCMFQYCYNLTSLDVSNWNTSEVNNMGYIFWDCYNLTSLDVSNWDTSNVTHTNHMFVRCKSLASLDLSNFNTSKVTNMDSMFWECINLASLDLSNFNTSKVTNMQSMFYNTPFLKDIGMLYCSQSTINALSSKITTPSTSVWVKGSMIDDLTSYDNVTYKAYYWEREVLLNSPLLEGDKIVKKDGKLYHYHKMGKVVLDGSEDWNTYGGNDKYSGFAYGSPYEFKGYSSFSDKFIENSDMVYAKSGEAIWTNTNQGIYISISTSKLVTPDVNGFKQWLQANPTTVVYELKNPYYELISDTSDDLSLPLVSEDNIISNNSLIPPNMNVKNNGMSTVAMNTSTKYTVAFDKDTNSSVTIDLCGSTIDTTDNVVEITTPSELANDEITFIGDCEVSNVRILKGSVSGDAIPKESFEGLKNSFEDSKIPSKEDVLDDSDLRYYNGNIIFGIFKPSIKLNTLYTAKVIDNTNKVVRTQISTGNGSVIWKHRTSDKTFKFTTNTSLDDVRFYLYSEKELDASSTNGFAEEDKTNINIIVLEGDWTHLTEEDWNNLGKYKVEYKVTGKNLIDMNKTHLPGTSLINNNGVYSISKLNNLPSCYIGWNLGIIRKGQKIKIRVKAHDLSDMTSSIFIRRTNIDNTEYPGGLVIPSTLKLEEGVNEFEFIYSLEDSHLQLGIYPNYNPTDNSTTKISELCVVKMNENEDIPTEYEPYKSYTKTFYLNSPLLEGDTIEDVNGVATHVKRCEKVVLDGSEDEGWTKVNDLGNSNVPTCIRVRVPMPYAAKPGNSLQNNFNVITNKYITPQSDENISIENSGYINSTGTSYYFVYAKSTYEEFKSNLQQNPLIIVYELASPQYEPISTESILCDSYVNGHLDVDSNIPVEKVGFNHITQSLRYLTPSTKYRIQFDSDNVGILYDLGIASKYIYKQNVTKGINNFSITTPDVLPHTTLRFNGIGFNASNIQVVATERNNIGYFKGIQSSFEDKVIRSKNLFNKDNIVLNYGFGTDGSIINPSSIEHSTEYIECKPNTSYICNFGTGIHYFDENKTWISYQNHGTSSPSNAKYLVKCIGQTVDLNTVQIVEGKDITTYEPYGNKYEVKVTLEDENGVISNEFIYLNSPLLKGDRIEMYNGKLCHYHKMGKVVLDGSENWAYNYGNLTSETRPNTKHFHTDCIDGKVVGTKNIYCDRFSFEDIYYYDIVGINVTSQKHSLRISYTSKTLDEFKQWLQSNPTTVVYQLAEPYYEDITPIQNEFVITSIGESSFTIDSGAIPTDGEITYSVNVKLLNDLEESINNNTSSTDTDLSTILDDIINE